MVAADLRKKPGMESYDKGTTTDIFSRLKPHLETHARKHAPKVLADAKNTNVKAAKLAGTVRNAHILRMIHPF
jgi:hypothetical protein